MWKKILIGCVVTVCVAFGVLVGAVFFSPLPLKLVTGRLARHGIHVEGVGGSLSTGIRMDRLSYENEQYAFDFEGAELRWSSLFRTAFQRKVGIELLETRKGRLVIKAEPAGAPSGGNSRGAWPLPGTTPPEDPAAPASPVPPAADAGGGFFRSAANPQGFDEFRIDRIAIKDLTVKDEIRQKEFVVNELAMENFVAHDKESRLRKLSVESDQLSLALTDASLGPNGFAIDKPIAGRLKPALAPDVLRKELSFSAYGQFKGSMPETFEVKMADDKVIVRGDLAGFTLAVNDFTASEYFATDLPLGRITAKSAAVPLPMVLQAAIPLAGTFAIGPTEFRVSLEGQRWVGNGAVGRKKYRIFIPTVVLVTSLMSGSGAGTLQLSGPSASLDRNLADIYFGKTAEALTPAEKTQIEQAKRYFRAAGG